LQKVFSLWRIEDDKEDDKREWILSKDLKAIGLKQQKRSLSPKCLLKGEGIEKKDSKVVTPNS